jgi:hypothetical protein
MSQTGNKGNHKLSIKNKQPGTLSTGANTLIELDGKPLRGVTFLKLECKPANVVKVTMEMYAEVEAEIDTQFSHTMINPDEEVIIGDAIYVLSRYETIGVPTIKRKKKIVEE